MIHKKQLVPAFLAACALLTLSGCELFQDIFGGGSVKVSFSLASAGKSGSKSAKDTIEPLTPNEVVVFNALGPNPSITHTPIDPEGTTLELSRNSINIIGFVYNPSLAPGSPGGRIVSLGTFKILLGSYSLDSLPISELAEDELDLGELEATDSVFLSDIDELSLAQGTGYDSTELRAIAFLDQIGSTKLNCDIDGNGVYDQEEGKRWDFKVIYDFNIPLADLTSLADGTETAWTHAPSIVYYPQLWSGFSASTEQPQVFLELPAAAGVQDGSGNPVDSLACTHLWDAPYLDVEYYFGVPDTYTPKAPYDGTYKLSMPGTTLEFADLHFVNQSNAYEGFFFPVCSLDSAPDGKLKALRYGWKMIHDGMVMDADPSLVLNFTNQVLFGLHFKPEYGTYDHAIFIRNRGDANWQLQFKGGSNGVISSTLVPGEAIGISGSFDLSSTDLYLDDIEYIRNDIHDISENIFAFGSR